MQRSSFYARFISSWLAIVMVSAIAFAMAVPAQAQQAYAVTTASLNMRTGPGTNYGVILAIPRGATVSVLECTSGRTWCELNYNGRAGWSSASYLSFQTAAPQPPAAAPPASAPPANGVTQVQTTVSLNMRRGPGTSYAVVRAIPAGANVSVNRCIPDYTWCEVSYAGSTGWASARYLRSPQYNEPVPSVGEQLGLAIFQFVLGQFAGGGQQPPQPEPPQQQREPAANEVCFYRDYGYQGPVMCARMGQSDASLGGGWNDAISSVRVGANAAVEVCRDTNYGHPCRVFGRNDARLPTAWNDAISSFRTTSIGGGNPPPQAGRACFFENWNYDGPSVCYEVGQETGFLGNWNDRISSFRLDPGVSVVICSDANLSGNCRRYTGSVAQLTGDQNDTASSLRVR